MAKAKGTGSGSCCCGGCWIPPTDPRAATTADIIDVQQYCCRCIPRYLCATISGATGYDSSSVLLTRFCGADYEGSPIQYAGSISWDGVLVTIRVRLTVVYEVCYIEWEIPDEGESGSIAIDHSQYASEYDCAAGMTTEACVNFGGTWELSDRTLTLAPPSMLDIASNIDCAGCSCMCRCLCMSIASQESGGNFSITGSNEVVCAVLTETEYFNCDSSRSEILKTSGWTSNGWMVRLVGGVDEPPLSRTVNTGTETSFAPCSITDLLRSGDGDAHEIADDAGTVLVTYRWDIDERTPLSIRWLGRSHDEYSTVEFEAYNWTTTSWDSLGTVAGRAGAVAVNRFFKSDLGTDYVGTGLDEGTVDIRIRATGCSELQTDLLRLTTTRCCKLELIPPESVVPTTTLEKFDLSLTGNCANPFKFWNFEDESGTTWYISIDCSWCDGTCGTVSTECCPRPVSRTLFAEVTIDCPTCIESPFVVPLIGDGSIWDGEATHCAVPFNVSLACEGNAWTISVEGAGACSFSGTADTTDCDPFNLTFSGTFGGGVGCCGPFGGAVTPAISITVIE